MEVRAQVTFQGDALHSQLTGQLGICASSSKNKPLGGLNFL